MIRSDIVCVDAPPPIRMQYIHLPAYFIDIFVHALMEELSVVFGYIWWKGGKLSEGIACKRMNRGIGHGPRHDCIGNSKMRGCWSADAIAAKVEEYEIRALSTAGRETAAADDPIAAMERYSGEDGGNLLPMWRRAAVSFG
jgi:hypothetical protein